MCQIERSICAERLDGSFSFVERNVMVDDLKGRNVPIPVETDMQVDQLPVYEAGHVFPNGVVYDPAIHRVLPNGAIFDNDRKRIVANPGGGIKGFNSERSAVAFEKKMQMKRESLMAGAIEYLENVPNSLPTDEGVIKAIGKAAMSRALNDSDKNARQIDAMKFLFREFGISEEQASAQIEKHTPANELFDALMTIFDRLGVEIVNGKIIEPATADNGGKF